jgi:hypothetical protein
MTTAATPPKSGPTALPTHLKTQSDPDTVARRHLLVGWWSLLLFLTLGMVLEALHGFKVGAYLKVSNETRRLMWTLAHAHGTLLALVNLAFGFMVRLVPDWPSRPRAVASLCLRGATGLMPAGFFLGGTFIYSGDPGLGILLVPIGGILLFIGVLLAARGAAGLRAPPRPTPPVSGKRK